MSIRRVNMQRVAPAATTFISQVSRPPVATWRNTWYASGPGNALMRLMPLSADATNLAYCFFLPTSSYGFSGNGIGMVDSNTYLTFILTGNTIYTIGNNQLRTLGNYPASNTDIISLTAIETGDFIKIAPSQREIWALSANGRLFHRGQLLYINSATLFDARLKAYGSSGYTFTDIAANNDGVFALSGTDLYVSGRNNNGSIGIGVLGSSRTNYISPWQQITGKWSKIRTNPDSTFTYIQSAGTRQWHVAGYNTWNMGGVSPSNLRSGAMQGYSTTTPGDGGWITQFIPITGNWDDISVGGYHTLALSGTDLYAIGRNEDGQLGVGYTSNTGITTGSFVKVPITCDRLPRYQGLTQSVVLTGNRLYGAGNALTTILLNCGANSTYTTFTELMPGSVWDDVFFSNTTLFALSSFATPQQQSQAAAPNAPFITNVANDAVNNYINVDFTAGNSFGIPIANYQYSLNDGLNWTAISPPDNLTPITITSVTDGANYAIRLQTVNAYGGVSEGSNSIPFTFIPNNTLATQAGPSIVTDNGRFILVG